MKNTVVLVEADVARRAELTRFLTGHWHVEPFEEPAELGAYWPRDTAFIFAADEGDVIDRLMEIPNALCVPILAYSDAPRTERVVQAIRRGVTDYYALPLDPDAAMPRLTDTIKHARAEIEIRQQQVHARRMIADLSPREQDIGRELLAGHSNKGIAKTLGISPRTVEIHRANMMKKMGATSTAEAVRILLHSQSIN